MLLQHASDRPLLVKALTHLCVWISYNLLLLHLSKEAQPMPRTSIIWISNRTKGCMLSQRVHAFPINGSQFATYKMGHFLAHYRTFGLIFDATNEWLAQPSSRIQPTLPGTRLTTAHKLLSCNINQIHHANATSHAWSLEMHR